MKSPLTILILCSLLFLPACIPGGHRDDTAAGPGPLRAVNLNDPLGPSELPVPQAISGARNEWLSMAVRVTSWRGGRNARLRVSATGEKGAALSASSFAVYQIIDMPVDQHRAGYVRHTGLPAGPDEAPRALLPVNGGNGLFDLSNLRDPYAPIDAVGRKADGSSPVLLWVDVHIPEGAAAGVYQLSVDLLDNPNRKPVATLPVRLDVHDFDLPQQRNLDLVAKLDWDDLAKLNPEMFANVTPRLLNRDDPKSRQIVNTLDRLIALAQAHHANIFVPQLQPTVKWPSGSDPSIDWADFDSLVTPWLSGRAFADGVPLSYWPLPAPDGLSKFDRASQNQYWKQAAAHFDQRDWLERSAIMLGTGLDKEVVDDRKPTDRRLGSADSVRLSGETGDVLASHPRVRVTVPLEQDQVQFAWPGSSDKLVPPNQASRLMLAAPGVVFSSPAQAWPRSVATPELWLRTDLPGLIPFAGTGGDERDVRLWAWLAFLRKANVVLWDNPLPQLANPRKPADPSTLTWFYPGKWFGVDEPVPTVQLKWLRRAQQDFEYLRLAADRGEVINTRLLARLITKPVEIQPNQTPDPVYALMSGTSDADAWDDALRIVARTIEMRKPGIAADEEAQHQLYLETLRWIEPQERPQLVGRSTNWLIDPLVRTDKWMDLRLGIDVYNASDDTPAQSRLQWTAISGGWRVQPTPLSIPTLPTYRVRRISVDARVNLDDLPRDPTQPVELTFTHGFTQRQTKVSMVAPVAPCDRRETRVAIDGSLADWREVDAIQSGPLVKMLDRPSIQHQELRYTRSHANVYTNWADDNLYVAFRLEGLDDVQGRPMKNFVDYQFRRAWGEDLAEILVQPQYADNSLGPVLHIACKPSGTWVERKLDERTNVDPWMPLEGAAVRYAATIDDSRIWRAELAIPWKAIGDLGKGRPTLLRFNFSQHRSATGESGSWAGPIDFGREDAFTGVLYVRDTAMGK